MDEEKTTPTENEPLGEKKPKKKMRLSNILVALIFVAIIGIGLIVMFYPNIANYINTKNQSKAVTSYMEKVTALDTTDYNAYLDAAREYNQKLYASGAPVTDAFRAAGADENKTDVYWSLLDVNGKGTMGYVQIDSLDIEIALYHGSSEDTLAVGAGHLQGTSLPVGGENTHTVISAHTGLPSGKFFDGIDQLKIGDTFELFIMNEIFTYQVDQILVVLPEEVDALNIVPGKDLATLVTCTPYGINTHRLLVRGARIETPPETIEEHIKTASIGQADEPEFFGKIKNAIVAFLAQIVETAAQGIINTVQWFMDKFGIEY